MRSRVVQLTCEDSLRSSFPAQAASATAWMSRPGSASASMAVIRRASYSRDGDVVPLTASLASTGKATGRARNGSFTTTAATTQLLPRPVLRGPWAEPS